MRPEELAFIKGAKGRLTANDLGECYAYRSTPSATFRTADVIPFFSCEPRFSIMSAASRPNA